MKNLNKKPLKCSNTKTAKGCFTLKNHSNSKELVNIMPEREFNCYKLKVLHGTNQYKDIIELKTFFSLKGYKSHPIFFDILVKENKEYFIFDLN